MAVVANVYPVFVRKHPFYRGASWDHVVCHGARVMKPWLRSLSQTRVRRTQREEESLDELFRPL